MRLESESPRGQRTHRYGGDPDGISQVGHHAADDRELLGVLLPEVGPVPHGHARLGGRGAVVQQLRDDGEHPVEVPGA